MKKKTIIFFIINVITLTLLFTLNKNFIYLFDILLLICLLVTTLNKNTRRFIITTFLITITSITLFTYTKPLYFLIYLITLLTYIKTSLKYISKNLINIKFKTLKIPTNKEHLIVKYINTNGIVTKNDNSFLINLEENTEIKTIQIPFKDIKKINITEKPYNITIEKQKNKPKNPYKYTKIIRSYNITITTKNKEISLTSFDYPKIFEKDKNN